MTDLSRLSLDIADLPLTPFGMRSPLHNPHQMKSDAQIGLTKLSRPQTKSPTVGAPAEKLIVSCHKDLGKENAPPFTVTAARGAEPYTSQQKFSFCRPLRPVRKNSKLPALAEEDSDEAFVAPSPFLKKTPVSRNKVHNLPTKTITSHKLETGSPIKKSLKNRNHSKRNNCKASNCHDTSVLDMNSGNCLNSVHLNSGKEKRRDSQFTDIDDGSFVEFTSEIPEGRIIPHTDSLVALRNNLYMTCPEYANETEYSTSSKMPNARYNFHHMIGAIKQQHFQPQISEEFKFSSRASPSCSPRALQQNKYVGNNVVAGKSSSGQILNSTMIDDKKGAQVPFIIPDISALTIEDFSEDPQKNIPRQSNSNLCPTESNTNAAVVPSSTKNLNAGDSSVASEDVLLASSDHSLREIEDLPNKILRTGNEADKGKESTETKEASEDELPSTLLVQKTLHHSSASKDLRDVPVNTCNVREVNEPGTRRVNNFINYAAKSTDPLLTASPNFDNLRKYLQVQVPHRQEKEPLNKINFAVSNVMPTKIGNSVKIPATMATPLRKLQDRVYSPGKKVSNTPNLPNCKATPSVGQSPAVLVSTTSQSCTPTTSNLVAINSPAILPKSSVCKWVMNSPFKDSSFGTSFAKKLGTNCEDQESTVSPSALSVIESSDESSNELVHSEKDELFCYKKRPNDAREIPQSKTKVQSASIPSNSREVSVPSAAPKRTESASEDEIDKLIERASNLESLKLRLEGSSRTHATTLTLGRIAKQRNDIAGENLTSDEDVLPILQFSATQSVKSNDTENERRSAEKDASKNPFVTERKKKKNMRRAISKKLFESPPLKTKSSKETDPELKSTSRDPPYKAQKSFKPTSKGKNDVDESSDSDELTDYLSKWRKPQTPAVKPDGNDGGLSDFFTDDESSGEEINYRLAPLSNSIARKVDRKERNSVSEFLNENRNKKTQQLVSEKQISDWKLEKVIVLSDSSDSLPSPKSHGGLPRPSASVVHLSDSDDDDIKLMPSRVVCKTPQPIKTKTATKVCPKTDIPVRKKNNQQNLCSGYGTPSLSFLASLSKYSDNLRLHPDAVVYKKSFAKSKEQLTDHLYKLFNGQVFDNKLPQEMKITWNVRMTKTAGFCYYQIDRSKPSGRGARVELSTKVVDCCERLRDTLIHELCHAAAWIISGYKDGHGPLWRTWASRALVTFPELPDISRCHNYQIACKFTYQCTKCGYSIGRHSKSLDTERKVCGRCHGRFELLQTNRRAEGAGALTPRTPGPFALFVKENYSSVKKSTDLKHSDVMKVLGEKFRLMKT